MHRAGGYITSGRIGRGTIGMKRWKKRSYIRKQEWLQIEDYYKETLDEMKKEQTEIRQHIEKLSDKIDNFCAKMERGQGGIQEELGVLEKLIKMLLVNSLLDEVEHNTDSILNHSEKKNIEVLTGIEKILSKVRLRRNRCMEVIIEIKKTVAL